MKEPTTDRHVPAPMGELPPRLELWIALFLGATCAACCLMSCAPPRECVQQTEVRLHAADQHDSTRIYYADTVIYRLSQVHDTIRERELRIIHDKTSHDVIIHDTITEVRTEYVFETRTDTKWRKRFWITLAIMATIGGLYKLAFSDF